MTEKVATAPRVRFGALWEVLAISIAWPAGLIRFGIGLVTDQPVEAAQGLAFFLIVYFYTLVRLYQSSRVD
jgi:hypothetical protein